MASAGGATAAEEALKELEAGALGRAIGVLRERPVLAVAIAGGAGVLLGALIFRHLGRLAFIAAAGYVANDLWHRDGGVDIEGVLRGLMK